MVLAVASVKPEPPEVNVTAVTFPPVMVETYAKPEPKLVAPRLALL